MIRYYIPQNTRNASISIYTMDGTEILNTKITTKGLGQTEIHGGTLSSGIYTYILSSMEK
ncbi:MAG: hypothetical protein IPM91_12995 [Bacteroidetes bacterium]|nr:hypothetical protein [Bacteroidota bacterium]